MKRYTAQIQLKAADLQADQIKKVIERAILHGWLPSVYRLGLVTQTDANTVLVEIASELKRERLLERLKGLETKLPIQVDHVGWGWLTTDPNKQVTGLTRDPYVLILPQQTANETYTFGRRQLIKNMASIGLDVAILLFIGLLLFDPTVREAFVGQSRSFISQFWWMPIYFSILFGVPAIPVRYIAYIRCGPEDVEIKYGWPFKSQVLKWAEINTLKHYDSGYTLYTDRRSFKFLAGEITPVERESQLIKTILERAALVYAEDSRLNVVYKRFDAQ